MYLIRLSKLIIYCFITNYKVMDRKNSHASQLPSNIANWQTNFTEMKHRVIDYLRKHNPDQSHSIVDARHYLILNHPNNHTPNSALFCAKIPESQQYPTHSKDSPFAHHDLLTADRSHHFTPVNKVSAHPGQGHPFQDDGMRGLPSIYSLQLEPVAKGRHEGYRQATLRQKMGSSNNDSVDWHQQPQVPTKRQRFQSIQVVRPKPQEASKKIRANSMLKREAAQYERVKTYSESEKKNIFFIPVAQYIRQHQQAINSTPIPPKTSQKDPKSHQDIHQPSTKLQNHPAPNHLNDPLGKEEDNFSPMAPEMKKKELHSGTHKRMYAHGKDHRHQVHVLEKEMVEKFVVTPWENIHEEATITNLDQDNTDS